MPFVGAGEARIFFEVRGEGAPVLGIMGWGLDQRYWAAQAPAIAHRHRFITFDPPGVGRSPGPPAQTVAAMATDALALLDELDIGEAIVFGVSLGGAVAQVLALDHPERVRALILGMTWARPIEYMRRQGALARRVLEIDGARGLVEASLVWMFTPRFFEVGRDTVDLMLRGLGADSAPEITSREVLLAHLDAIGRHDVAGRLGQVACPTLVYGGRMDTIVPFFASEEIAEAIPGAEMAAFATGHGLMVEETEAVNARIARFLASL